MTRRASTFAVAIAAALLAAGCGGGGDDETSSEAAWADGVCTSVSTWIGSVTETASSLSAGSPTPDRIQASIDDVKTATSTLVDDLQGLGAPESDAGQQAKASVDDLANALQQDVGTIEDATKDITNVSEALAAIPTITATVSSMQQAISSTTADLKQASGTMRDAFDQADSCKQLSRQAS